MIFKNLKNKIKTLPREGEVKNNISLKGLNVVRQYAALLERRVQSSTRVRKALVVTRQTNYIISLRPQCAPDATEFLSDVYKKGTRAQKFLADGVQSGRSMIEMLGVLAIIAVLSVGGIAGYSKAMEKFKLNKMVQQYNEMLFGVVQNLDEFHAPFEWKSTEIIKALNIVPPSWTVYKTSNTNSMKDDLGNTITWFPESNKTLRIMFDLNGKTQIQKKMCTEIASNVFVPLRSVLGMIYIEGGLYYYGDTYCSPNLKPYEKCIKDLSLSGINSICTNCVKNHCYLWLYFYH